MAETAWPKLARELLDPAIQPRLAMIATRLSAAMVLFALADKDSYAIALTRDGFDWRRIPLGAEAI